MNQGKNAKRPFSPQRGTQPDPENKKEGIDMNKDKEITVSVRLTPTDIGGRTIALAVGRKKENKSIPEFGEFEIALLGRWKLLK